MVVLQSLEGLITKFLKTGKYANFQGSLGWHSGLNLLQFLNIMQLRKHEFFLQFSNVLQLNKYEFFQCKGESVFKRKKLKECDMTVSKCQMLDCGTPFLRPTWEDFNLQSMSKVAFLGCLGKVSSYWLIALIHKKNFH